SVQPLADECSRCNRRPDRIADGNLPGDQRSLRRWFDTAAFALATGHYGTSGRNVLTAPGLASLDFSLFKNFRIAESKNLQFRWEMYNATNTPSFNPPGLGIGTGTFGQITSAGLPREMQFGLRFEF
ncbi:MAG TPA: TonB-dependent receptor, partial [Bryobacteraceae bacterium]|nr:TonB-dependent receptor [Bryobacteraceae bacterium]